MENILTIISEYNPFHFGHLYQLDESIKLVNPVYKIAIISGNFVQRGEPSIINKWEKAQIAFHYGFDLIIELPTLYSISSAENFASGAVKIAQQIGTTHLSFGSEIGDIDKLKKLSSLINNSPDFIENVKEKISKGFSYPKAQEIVIDDMFSNEFKDICKPNNILGLEYLKAIEKIDSNITPITIKRNADFESSSQIRNYIRNGDSLDNALPSFSQDILEKNKNDGSIVYSLKSFEKEIIYNIRKMSIDELCLVPDMSENLVRKFKTAVSLSNDLEAVIYKIKNKGITQARIQRILLYILLNIKKEDMDMSKNVMPYIRVLAVSTKGKKLLSSLSHSNNNVVTSVKGYERRCESEELLRMFDIDRFATDVYTLAYERNSIANLDYTAKIIDNILGG